MKIIVVFSMYDKVYFVKRPIVWPPLLMYMSMLKARRHNHHWERNKALGFFFLNNLWRNQEKISSIYLENSLFRNCIEILFRISRHTMLGCTDNTDWDNSGCCPLAMSYAHYVNGDLSHYHTHRPSVPRSVPLNQTVSTYEVNIISLYLVMIFIRIVEGCLFLAFWFVRDCKRSIYTDMISQ